MARVVGQAKAAAALGTTVQTLKNWKLQTWWNPGWLNDEGYDVEAIAKRPGADAQSERNKADADARRMNQKERSMRLQLMQMRVDERAGQLVGLQAVVDGIREQDEGLVNVIMDIPVRAARLIPEGKLRNEVMTEIDLICRNALRSHADGLRNTFERIKSRAKKQK
jgi:hypothetical protein